MKKMRLKMFVIGVFVICIISACSVGRIREHKKKDLDFTIVRQEDLPDAFKQKIREQQKEVFLLTYADAGYLYVAKGYGEQDTSGYSVEVKECYETEDAIYVNCELLGPQKGEEIAECKTYPYLTVKMEYCDKEVRSE